MLRLGAGLHRQEESGLLSPPALPASVGPLAALRKAVLVPFVPGSGLTVLENPLAYPGCSSFPRKAFARVVDRLEEACTLLGHLGDTQIQHHLLRVCLDACRANHLLRSAPCASFPQEVCRACDVIRGCLEVTVGTGLTSLQWAQARLPTWHEGLGLGVPQAPLAGR